jgi:Thiol:disulfide interchange protein
MHLTKPFPTLFLTLALLLLARVCPAQVSPASVALTTAVHAYSMTDEARAQAGVDWKVLLTVTLDMEPQWYTYADDPGDIGKPTVLSGTTADGVALVPVYPAGYVKPDAYDPSVMINAFPSGTRLLAGVPVESQRPLPAVLRLDLLLCHPTRCVPVRRDLAYVDADTAALPSAQDQPWWPAAAALIASKAAAQSPAATVPDTPNTTQNPSADADEASVQWSFSPVYLQPGLEVAGLLSAILMGLLAGLILNIMPCVLPVVSLKLSALLNPSAMANETDRIRAFREHNIFFALGVLAFFMVLAALLGATGQAWGALFQKQWLVLAVAGVILILSLSLFGLFHLPVIDLKFGVESKSPRVQAFFTGNLTTLLATPCSGPFLGGVLSWALVQGPAVIFAVFASLGLGMASPYLLMALNPRLSRFLPRSGPWIEYVEKSIAFFLVGTAVYLVSIALGSWTLRILAPLWALTLGAWLWMRTRTSAPTSRWSVRAASLALLVALVVWTTPSRIEIDPWQSFDPVMLQQQIGNDLIFIDFTADWCPTCKVLEATVLTPENIIRWKREYDITFIKVDLTERNMEGESLLQALGSMSIPTAALFSPGENSASPLVLRDLYTQSQLENILKSWKK